MRVLLGLCFTTNLSTEKFGSSGMPMVLTLAVIAKRSNPGEILYRLLRLRIAMPRISLLQNPDDSQRTKNSGQSHEIY